VYDQELS
jgi:hypothetical protein